MFLGLVKDSEGNFKEDEDQITNGEDPDQTASLGGLSSAQFALAYTSMSKN